MATEDKRAKAHAKTKNSHDEGLLVALGKPVTIKPYHHKPFRFRHLGVLLLTIGLVLALTLQAGVLIGQNMIKGTGQQPTTPQVQPQGVGVVRSSLGVGFAYGEDYFTVSATQINEAGNSEEVLGAKLRSNLPLNTIITTPIVRAVPAADAASRFVVQVDTDEARLVDAKVAQPLASDGELAKELMPLATSSDFTVIESSNQADTLAGVPVLKTVHEYVPKFDGGKSYSVSWTGAINGRAFRVSILGLSGSSAVPAIYAPIFDTLSLNGSQKVAGASTDRSNISDKFKSDAVSPSVVKIYHIYCGTLVVGGSRLGSEGCDGATGSGFLLSEDGYIGTNGHVAVFTAKDAFVRALTSNPRAFVAFLRAGGMSSSQIAQVLNRPELLAAIIGRIYDLPDEQVKFEGAKDALIVALGDRPLELDSLSDAKKTFTMSDTDTMKKAELIASDYSAKDLYALSTPDGKFESSDVALLKINISKAPALKIASAAVTQNEKISLIGFPGDAENALVSKDTLSLTVTNGTVSSIREAAGGNGKLYQSDADASQGNSGGPAVDENGDVIGLLTYRYKDATSQNAAKSYIRDIADLTELASSKNVNFSGESSTQEEWTKGLALYSQNRYSRAVKHFEKVTAAYPSHRLASDYIGNAKQAIKDGKDVKDFPWAVFIVGLLLALGALGAVIFIIARQHARHHVYKLAGQPNAPATVGYAAPGQPGQLHVQQAQPQQGLNTFQQQPMPQPQQPMPQANQPPQPQQQSPTVSPPVEQPYSPQVIRPQDPNQPPQ